jgi:hypothetical protein
MWEKARTGFRGSGGRLTRCGKSGVRIFINCFNLTINSGFCQASGKIFFTMDTGDLRTSAPALIPHH